jgi:hypothetical protein
VSKDRTVRAWDPAGGRPLRTLSGHPGEVEAVAFSPDGSLLATGDLAGKLRVWDAQSWDLLTEANHGEPPGQIWRLQFGPQGEYLAAAGGHVAGWTVRAAPGRVALERLFTLGIVPGSPGMIDLAARPGAPELVFLNRGGRLYSYDLSRADEPRLVLHARVALRSLHFTPAGDRLTLITSGGTLGLWNWPEKKTHDTRLRAESVALSADGRWAAVGQGGRKVAVVELPSGREVLALPAEGSDVWCLAWAPDGNRLAAGLSDGAVVVWDLEQVRARLAEFGLGSPSTRRADGIRAPAPVPAFDRVVRVNGLRQRAERAHRLATEARNAANHAAERDHLLTALDLEGRLAEAVPDAPFHRRRLAWTHGAVARVLERTGGREVVRHREAEARLLVRLVAEDPGNALYRERLMTAYHHLAFQRDRAGRSAEAQRLYQAALAVGDRLAADVPATADTPSFRFSRGATFHNLGIHRARAGATSAAEKLLRQAAAIWGRLADDFPADPAYASRVGLTLAWQGAVLRDLGQLDESARVVREAIRRQRAALGRRPGDPVFRERCCLHHALLADVLLRLARHADAAAAAREVPRLAPDDGPLLLRAGRVLARCVAPAERDPDLSPAARSARADEYRREAVTLARRAASRGLPDAARLLADPAFDSVWRCDEFRRLLDEVTPRKTP